MQDQRANIAQATSGACILERGLRTPPARLNTVCASALRCLTGFRFSGLLERRSQRLAQNSVRDAESPFASDQSNFSYSIFYSQDCQEALYRNPESDPERARDETLGQPRFIWWGGGWGSC